MKIRDVNGYVLYLSKTRLTEHEKNKWYLNLVDIPETIDVMSMVKIRRRQSVGSPSSMPVRCNPIGVAMQEFYLSQRDKTRGHFRIGCHHFSKKTFAVILKAAKEARRAAAKR